MKNFCSFCSLLFRSQSLAQGAWSNLAQRWPAWRHEWRGKITSEHRSNNWLQNDIKGDGGVDGQWKECQYTVPWSGQVGNMWCLPCKIYLVHFLKCFNDLLDFVWNFFTPGQTTWRRVRSGSSSRLTNSSWRVSFSPGWATSPICSSSHACQRQRCVYRDGLDLEKSQLTSLFRTFECLQWAQLRESP